MTNLNILMFLQVGPTVEYCQRIGNSYTASSFVNLMCLIEQQREQLEGKSIGVFSYGSGALATLYTLEVCWQLCFIVLNHYSVVFVLITIAPFPLWCRSVLCFENSSVASLACDPCLL